MRITLKMFLEAVKNGMKVLHIDTETSLGTFCGFQIGSKVSISYEQILTAPQVMSVQYKWEGEKKAKYIEWDKVGDKTVYDSGYDNSSMLEETSRLLNEADIVVGQNLDSFDIKMLQDGLVNNKLPPLDIDATIDILKMSRKVFRPLSHKLDARARKYGYVGKIKMELQDWKDITFDGKPISAKMGPYGCRDVDEEQRIFYREFEHYKLPVKVQKIILSFLKDKDKPTCTRCEVSKRSSKYNITKYFDETVLKDVYRCNCCGLMWDAKFLKKANSNK